MPKETPGQRLRVLRQAKELTQQQLADLVHSSQSAVAQWEADLWLPNRPTQHVLADALGVQHAFLFPEVAA